MNEAFDESGALKPSIWYDRPGIGLAHRSTAYIEQAFRWAHDADAQALLFYNDSGAETTNAKSDAIYAMVKDFKLRAVPIDGVGMQMHIFDLHADADGISRNIARFTALGLQVHITEMDVAVPLDAAGHASPSDLTRQAEIYRAIASACLIHAGCTAIQTWGFTDKGSVGRPKAPRGMPCFLTGITGPNPHTRQWKTLAASRLRHTQRHPHLKPNPHSEQL